MSPDSSILSAADLIRRARHLVVLTGAGISTPSGIPDFRSIKSGLWNKANPLVVASLAMFRIRPNLFFDWIRPMIHTFLDALPNPAHLALAQLEQLGNLKAIVTQNIDALHQKAGSKNVIEVHGHIRQATCVRCYKVVSTDTILSSLDHQRVPRCTCGGVLKPNVILVGEQLPVREINAARDQTAHCDLMLVVGSSLTTTPVSDLPLIAKDQGAQLIVVNRQPTPIDQYADVVIRRDVALALPQIVALVLSKRDRYRSE